MTSLNLQQFVIAAFIHSKQFILSKIKDYGGLNLKIRIRNRKKERQKRRLCNKWSNKRQTKQIKITLK